MSFKLGAAIATMENLSEEGALGATEDALEAATNAVDVADGNTEVVAEAGEIDNLDTGIEDAFEAVDKVEELKDIAEETMQDGGMDEATAKAVEVAHESIMAAIGMSHRHSGRTDSPVLSNESYRSAQSRTSATKLTIEKLSESAGKIIENIKRALKHAWNMVQNFFAGIMRNRALMEKHLNSLEGKVKAIPAGASMKGDKIKGGVNGIRIDGKADADTASKVLQSASSLLSASQAVAAEVGKASLNDDGSAGKWVQDFSGKLTTAIHRLGTNGKAEGKDAYGYLAGGRAVVVEGGTDEQAARIQLVEVGKKAEEAAAPSVDQMKRLVTQAKTVLGELRAYEKSIGDLKKGSELALRSLDHASSMTQKASQSEDDKAGNEAANKTRDGVKKAARTVISAMNKFGGPVPGAAFAAVKATADYVTAGVNNYGSGAAEKKEEKK